MCLDENPDRARARARPLSPSTNRRPAREVKRADAPRDGSTEGKSPIEDVRQRQTSSRRLPSLGASKTGRPFTSRPVRAPICPASLFRTRGDPRRRAERRKGKSREDVCRDDKRLPGCFRLSARRVDMLREFRSTSRVAVDYRTRRPTLLTVTALRPELGPSRLPVVRPRLRRNTKSHLSTSGTALDCTETPDGRNGPGSVRRPSHAHYVAHLRVERALPSDVPRGEQPYNMSTGNDTGGTSSDV